MAGQDNVGVRWEGSVAVLTLDRPPVNAFNWGMLKDLEATLDELLSNDQARVILITGAGHRYFVAGADIKELLALRKQGGIKEFVLKGHAIYNKIEASVKPVIAAINGIALGGGFELTLACHIRILSDHARVGLPETNLGIIPGWGGTQRLSRIVGSGKALEMILSGDMIDAQEAYRLGLANQLVPDEQIFEEALRLAMKIARKSTLATQAALNAVIRGLTMPLVNGLEYEIDQYATLVNSRDAGEGLQAFLEKRQPNFADN